MDILTVSIQTSDVTSLSAPFFPLLCFIPSFSFRRRSGSYPYSESPLYSQAVTTPYYEAPPASGSQVTTPVTSQTAPVSAGTSTVSMFVTGPGQIVATAPSGTGGGAPAVAAGGASGGSGTGGEGNVTGGSYVIQSGYVLGSGSSSNSNNSSSSSSNQNYSHNARASPATVSILTEGEANSVPSADKKVRRSLIYPAL